jgi:hypothetical protein
MTPGGFNSSRQGKCQHISKTKSNHRSLQPNFCWTLLLKAKGVGQSEATRRPAISANWGEAMPPAAAIGTMRKSFLLLQRVHFGSRRCSPIIDFPPVLN